MLTRRITLRAWIWVSVCVQLSGLAFDATWHGLLNPGFEAITISQMVRHLASVHLLLHLGAVSVLLSTGWAHMPQQFLVSATPHILLLAARQRAIPSSGSAH
jgi:hypothetical protein